MIATQTDRGRELFRGQTVSFVKSIFSFPTGGSEESRNHVQSVDVAGGYIVVLTEYLLPRSIEYVSISFVSVLGRRRKTGWGRSSQ